MQDHAALSAALRDARAHDHSVACVFIFDTSILQALPSRNDRRVEFILHALRELDARLREGGGGLLIGIGDPVDLIPAIARDLGVSSVHAARDYEPSAVERDRRVQDRLHRADVRFQLSKDQVIFECDEVLTASGKPFSVYTPYRAAWMRKLADGDVRAHPVEWDAGGLADPAHLRSPGGTRRLEGLGLADLGFEDTDLTQLQVPLGTTGADGLLEAFAERVGRYHQTRDYPGVRGPSYLSAHLRFGTISIRRLVRFARDVMEADPAAAEGARVWLGELIWRDFYFQILHHHPHVVTRAFRPEYASIRWDDDEAAHQRLAAWRDGRTGYPLVDAAQRQLVASGYMHNRLRMVSASFLVKDLGIDWRLGERFFAHHLLDYDLAANNGGWQWAASTGCDAQPWFRIFNPVTQSTRFDPAARFIRRYVPELAALDDKAIHAPWLADAATLAAAGVRLGSDYPRPIVDHARARQTTLARFGRPGAGD